VDYMVLEAVTLRYHHENEEARKEQEKKDWQKRGAEELAEYAGS
jgi:hypothetical protein